jgi:serine/threonine protein kinase
MICDQFAREREDGSVTPVGLLCDWLDAADDRPTVDLVSFLDGLITDEYPGAVAYRDYLNSSASDFHEQVAIKFDQLEELKAILHRDDRDFESIVATAVLFFVIPGTTPDQLHLRRGPEDRWGDHPARPDLLAFIREHKHLPLDSSGPNSSYYPFEIVDKRPKVIGRRLFESIRPADGFDILSRRSAVIPDNCSGPDSEERVVVDRFALRLYERMLLCRFLRELVCQLICAHPCVLPLVGWNLTPYDKRGELVRMTLFAEPVIRNDENCRGFLTDASGLPATVGLKSAYGIARGMDHVHHLGILHRDLTLDRIFSDPDGPRIGLLRPMSTSRRRVPGYAAPEVLTDQKSCNLSADVYSYGIILWELMTDRLWRSETKPYDSGSSSSMPETLFTDEILRHGLRAPLTDLNPQARDMLIHCFGADTHAQKRYSFGGITRLLEKDPLAYFPEASDEAFREYKAYLDRAEVYENVLDATAH